MRNAFVIGHPVAHSRSPLIHGHWLARYGLEGTYERVDVAPERLVPFLREIAGRGYVGGNVTVPHKEAVFRELDAVSREARRLGAVNTLVVGPDGSLSGHNTDGAGFMANVAEAVGPGWEAGVRSALVLGAGGAARAIFAALADAGIARLTIANRTPERAHAVASLAPARAEVVAWGEVGPALEEQDLVVNTTSLGMEGQPALALPLEGLRPDAIVADIVYVPRKTELLAQARVRGCRIVEGLGMLLHQAVPGFEAWFGVRPQVTDELRRIVAADIEAAR